MQIFFRNNFLIFQHIFCLYCKIMCFVLTRFLYVSDDMDFNSLPVFYENQKSAWMDVNFLRLGFTNSLYCLSRNF